MLFSFTFNLKVRRGTGSKDAERSQLSVSSQSTAEQAHHPHLPDRKEDMLSPEILAMQRRIRKDKQEVRDARPNHENDEKPEGDVAKIEDDSKHKVPAEAEDEEKIKDDWQEVDLADVQASHLDAMDLTDLPPSLLAHPKGPDMDYTVEEERILEALVEKTPLE